jgi:hypothetical protein
MSAPPGSLGVPFLGEAREFFADPFDFVLSRTRRYGSVWKTRILGDTVVFFAGPEAFSFFVDPGHFVRRGAMLKPMQRLLHPEAVPFLDGEEHARRKRLLLAAFTDDALDSYLPGVFTIFERFCSKWVGQGEQRLADELPQLVSDVVEYLFAAGDPESSNGERAADLADCAAFLRTASLPLNLPFTAYGKALRARDRLRTHIRGQLAATDGAGTVLGALTTASGPDGEKLTPDELEISLVHFCLAAHPQLVAVLAWLFVVLGEHPGLARRVREEADGVLGDGAPTLAEVRGLAKARGVARGAARVSDHGFHVVRCRDAGPGVRRLHHPSRVEGCRRDLADVAGRLDVPRSRSVQRRPPVRRGVRCIAAGQLRAAGGRPSPLRGRGAGPDSDARAPRLVRQALRVDLPRAGRLARRRRAGPTAAKRRTHSRPAAGLKGTGYPRGRGGRPETPHGRRSWPPAHRRRSTSPSQLQEFLEGVRRFSSS